MSKQKALGKIVFVSKEEFNESQEFGFVVKKENDRIIIDAGYPVSCRDDEKIYCLVPSGKKKERKEG